VNDTVLQYCTFLEEGIKIDQPFVTTHPFFHFFELGGVPEQLAPRVHTCESSSVLHINQSTLA